MPSKRNWRSKGDTPKHRKVRASRGNEGKRLVLEVARKMLERLGYTVCEANSGAEAVEVYTQKQAEIEFVILDLVMPGMGGAKVYRKLKGLNPDLLIILASGYSADDQAKEILSSGYGAFIQKPFNIEELSEIIRKALQ